MNKKEIKAMAEMPSDRLNRAVNERFRGADCKTEYAFLSSNHITTFNPKWKGERRKRVLLFIEAWMAGWMALRDELEHINRQ